MTPERWETIKQVFDSALDLQPESRDSYLRDACKGDPSLYAEADRLLREFDAAGGFLDGSLFHATSTLTSGDVVAGRYRIVRLLGRGGMGEVYEAHDQMLGESVALKTLRAGLAGNPSILRRFQSEIQLARKVTHPNVCRIYEVGVDKELESGGNGLHFFVMEYLRGETLASRIHREGRLTKAQAFPIAARIAEGLSAAHKAGIVHRDLKSGNVMLVPGPEGDRAVITDFGLARLEISGATGGPATNPESELAIAGTVGYMSPEQFTGGEITAASDIYSFGIVLFEMATGKLPFDDQHLIRAAVQRANRDSAPVRTLPANIDERWKTAIARCLERDPAKRPPSAGLAEWFRKDAWQLPNLHWSPRQWIQAGMVAAVAVAAIVGLWMRTHRPYAPSEEVQRWYEKGVAAMHAMTLEAARKALERAVATDPRFALAHAALAEAYAEMDYSERANAEMLKAQAASEETHLSAKDADRFKALRFMVTRDFDRAAAIYLQLEKEAAGIEMPLAALDVGLAAEKNEDSAAAIKAYERATLLDPRNPAAKLRLGFALGRQRKMDAALEEYSKAEDLYTAESDHEGRSETYFLRAQLLNRPNQSEQRIAEIEKALRITEITGNQYQRIRLQLLEGVAYRNAGNTDKATALAKEAVQTATDNGMEGTAAVGVIDLGNAFFLRGEEKPAEEYLQQGFNLAKRSKARQSEARAQYSLATLRAQYDRPEEAKPLAEAASNFYRQGGYRRETVQALLLLGKIHRELSEFDEGRKVLRETIESAGRLNDDETASQAHLELGLTLERQGELPDALQEFDIALKGRTGLRTVYVLLNSADLYWRLNQGDRAEHAFEEAEAILTKEQGRQDQLWARLQEYRAERAYGSGQYSDALELASKAAKLGSGDDDTEGGDALLLQGLATLHLGLVKAGSQRSEAALKVYERSRDAYGMAWGRLLLAKALLAVSQKNEAAKLAKLSLEFFEPRHVEEQIWQAEWVLAETGGGEAQPHLEKARLALNDVSRRWAREDFSGYLKAVENSGIQMSWFPAGLRVSK